MKEDNHFSCIYKITNIINNKIYVGQTKDYHERVQNHLYLLRRNQSHCEHLQRAFNKYGEDNFVFSVIEKCPLDLLDEKEIYWINELNSVKDGYNLCYGGGGLRGYKQSNEAIKKRAEKTSIPIVCLNTGEVFDSSIIAAEKYGLKDISSIRGCCNGRNKSAGKDLYGERLVWMDYSDKYIDMPTEEILYIVWEANQSGRGIYNYNYGKHISDEQKKKMIATRKATISKYGNPNKGRKRPNIAGTNSYKAHAVICVNTGEYFNLINDAAKTYNIDGSSISACVSGNKAFAGQDKDGNRLIWVDADKYTPMTQNEIDDYFEKYDTSKSNKKKVICLTTDKVFDSIKLAATTYSIHPSGITEACKGRLLYYGKHPETNEKLYWKYA